MSEVPLVHQVESEELATRSTTEVSFPQNSGGNVTTFIPHKVLKLISSGQVGV